MLPAAATIGPFRLLRRLGRGGTGDVWLAEADEEPHQVALKILPARRDPASLQAFDREVRAAARLDHPGIVHVWDAGRLGEPEGVWEAGAPWLAMELCDHPLQPLQVPGWQETRRILEALLQALAHAHAMGVVHRDLKPNNILHHRRSEAAWPIKLTDFGLAWANEHAGEGAEGRVIGTPRYMAPEQFLGESRDYGPWTDLYAFGCVAWEIITGAPPFTGNTPASLSRMHLADEPPRLGPRFPLPWEAEAWLRRLLAKDPRDRYLFAADALLGLGSLGSGLRPAAPTSRVPPPDQDDTLIDLLVDPTGPQLEFHEGVLDDITAVIPLRRRVPQIAVSWQHGEPPHRRLPVVGLGLFGFRVPPLVGRELERDILWLTLREASTARQPRLALVHGAPGVGRTRLVDWLFARVHESGAAVPFRLSASADTDPSLAIATMLSRVLRTTGLSPTETAERIAGLLPGKRLAELRDNLLEVLGDVGDGVPAEQRWATALGVIRFFAGDRLVLLVLDDVEHSVDAVRFVRWLLDHRDAGAMALVTTHADPTRGVAAPEIGRLASHPATRPTQLAPLSDARVADMLEGLLPLEAGLVRQIASRSLGNPLFAVQMLGDLVHRGRLIDRGAGLEPRDGRLELPDDLVALWSARVEQVVSGEPTETRTGLELAAVLGPDVDAAEWRAAAKLLGLDVAHPAPGSRWIERALAWRLIEPTERGFSFPHAVLREVIERGAREAGRAPQLHAACARLLASARSGAAISRRGRHLLEAGFPVDAEASLLTGAATLLDADDPSGAEHALLDHARALGAGGAALDDPRWGENLLLRSRAHALRQELADAESLAFEAELLATRHGWDRIGARAVLQRAAIARYRGDLPLASALYERAEGRLRAWDPSPELAEALRSASHTACMQGDLERATALALDAFSRHQALGDALGVAHAHVGLGDIARARGDLDAAAHHFGEALAMYRARRLRSGVALARLGVAEVQRMRGDLVEAEAGYREALQIEESLGTDSSIPRLNLALCLIEARRFPDARAEIERLLPAWERQGKEGYVAIAHAALLPALAAARDWNAYDRSLQLATELLDRHGIVERDAVWPVALAATLARERGQPARAVKAENFVAAHDSLTARP